MGRISRVWAIGAVVLLAACSDQIAPSDTAQSIPPSAGPSPTLTYPTTLSCTPPSSEVLQNELTTLYVKNSWPDVNSILGKLNTVTNYLNNNDFPSAQAYMTGTLIPFLENKYQHLSADQQNAPITDGSSTTVKQYVHDLMAQLLCYVAIDNVFDLNPTDDAKSFEITGIGGVWFPDHVVPVGTQVFLYQLPPTVAPLTSPLDQFSGYLSIQLIPDYTFTDPNKLPVIVLCPDYGSTAGNLYVGHQASTGFELLPPPTVLPFNPCDSDPFTSNAGPSGWLASLMTRAAKLLLPETLRASMMGTLAIGGKGGSFSPFATTSTDLTAIGGKATSYSPMVMPSAADAPKPDSKAASPATTGPELSIPVAPFTPSNKAKVGTTLLATTATLPTATVSTQGKDLNGPNQIQGIKVTFTIGAPVGSGYYQNSNATFCVTTGSSTTYPTTIDVYTDANGLAEVPCIHFGTIDGFANVHAEVDPKNATNDPRGLTFPGHTYLGILEDASSGSSAKLNWLIQSTPGDPTGLVFISPTPASYSIAADATLPKTVVELQDANNHNTWLDDVPVTVSIDGGATVTGDGTTSSVPTINGDRVFTNLVVGGKVNAPGTYYTLTFNAEIAPGNFITATRQVTITGPGAADHLAITNDPQALTANQGAVLSPAPVVQVQDQYGNAVTGARTITAAFDLAPTGQIPGQPTLTGNSKSTTTTTNAATFDNLAMTGKAGSYTLKFSSSPLASVTSSSITLAAGAVSKLETFYPITGDFGTQQPFTSVSPWARVSDGYGNFFNGITVNWTLDGATSDPTKSSSGGSISATNSVTSSNTTPNATSDGTATVTWTLGDGANGLTAALSGSNYPSDGAKKFSATAQFAQATLAECVLSGTVKKTDLAKYSSTLAVPEGTGGYQGWLSIKTNLGAIGLVKTVVVNMSVTGQSSGVGDYPTVLNVYKDNNGTKSISPIATGKPQTGTGYLQLPGSNSSPSPVTFKLTPTNVAVGGDPGERVILEFRIKAPSTRTFQIWYNTKPTTAACGGSWLYPPSLTPPTNFDPTTPPLSGVHLKILNYWLP